MAASSEETRQPTAPNLRASASLDADVEMAHVSQPMALRKAFDDVEGEGGKDGTSGPGKERRRVQSKERGGTRG